MAGPASSRPEGMECFGPSTPLYVQLTPRRPGSHRSRRARRRRRSPRVHMGYFVFDYSSARRQDAAQTYSATDLCLRTESHSQL